MRIAYAKKNLFSLYGLTIAVAIALVTALAFAAHAKEPEKRAFKSPKEAFSALITAARDNDTKELLSILGPEGKDLISSGDAVADTNARQRFVRAASEKLAFSKAGNSTTLALIGKDGWCFPIPIVKSSRGWVFQTDEGKEEILNRRIGRNELNTIQVALAYVNSQKEYASIDRTGEGAQYAEHFLSHEGKKDGLYWEAAPGEEASPLGPLFASATEEGYDFTKRGKPTPYHGYYFKILKSQGAEAPGGAMDYVVDGKMTAGFGLVAYPAQYGVSGIMTFIVDRDGIVYEKDLGPDTVKLARAMTAYGPDKTWKRSETASASK